MKIPGLDEITANMNKFADMLPVLESINSNIKLLIEIQLATASRGGNMTGQARDAFLERIK